MDVDPRAFSGPFPCVCRVHVVVRLWTGINVLYRPFSVCSPCAHGCTPLDVVPRPCTFPFRCVRPVHVAVLLWTLIHMPLPALFGVFAFCTLVYATGRRSTCPYGPFSVFSPCARVFMPPKVDPRACTGPFRCLRSVYGGVCLWTLIEVPIPDFYGVFAMCTWVYASRCGSRACTGPFRCVHPVHVVYPTGPVFTCLYRTFLV